MTTEYEYGFADGRAAQARIARCPDRTTCQNEAMIEELREQLAAVTAKRDELSSLLAANVVVRAAQKLELDGVTAERDALQAKLGAVPMDAIREAQRFCATAFHPTANLDVMLGEWWKPFTSWLETEVTP